METTRNNAAKFAFFYMLSLIAMVFVAIAAGTIIFQIINKLVPDIADIYSSFFQEEAMRFGISALIIASPIYYITSRQIYKSLFNGSLHQDSGVRKWLTYLIILVAICVMIGWLIAILNGFLGGELTTKFILKALTAIVISGIVFSFYFYDIRRNDILNKVDQVIRVYFFGSLAIIIFVLVIAFINVGSPTQAREKKIDQSIINDFYQIQGGLNTYYNSFKKLPVDLATLQKEYPYITSDVLQNPQDKQAYVYNVTGENDFELCTTFLASNRNGEQQYRDNNWLHDAGYQCIKQKVEYFPKEVIPTPIPSGM